MSRKANCTVRHTLTVILLTSFITFALLGCGPTEAERRQQIADQSYPDFDFGYEQPDAWWWRWPFKPTIILGAFMVIAAALRGVANLPIWPKPRTSAPPVTSLPPLPPKPPDTIWHYREGAREFGPFTQDALIHLAAVSVIGPNTEIRRAGGSWVSYSDVFGG